MEKWGSRVAILLGSFHDLVKFVDGFRNLLVDLSAFAILMNSATGSFGTFSIPGDGNFKKVNKK